jgi:hypothetical protein
MILDTAAPYRWAEATVALACAYLWSLDACCCCVCCTADLCTAHRCVRVISREALLHALQAAGRNLCSTVAAHLHVVYALAYQQMVQVKAMVMVTVLVMEQVRVRVMEMEMDAAAAAAAAAAVS